MLISYLYWLTIDIFYYLCIFNTDHLEHATQHRTLNHLAKLAMIELFCEYLSGRCIWLYVIIMSRKGLRVNLHSIVAWMSKNSLLKTGAISEVEETAKGFEPTTIEFINKHATACPKRFFTNWVVFDSNPVAVP